MKKLLVVALLTLASAAQAQSLKEYVENGGRLDVPEYAGCVVEGEMFSLAAQMRDEGMSPEQALMMVDRYQQGRFPEKNIKQMINAIYFDPDFAQAGGSALMEQVTVHCLDPDGKHEQRFRPLQ